ncbi:MAG TPA: hypothetical protein VF069_19440 [Streptosporangiaceae bacterium]
MAWIAFACVPAMLVVMLAMGHLEARLLPPTPAQPGFAGPAGTDADDLPNDPPRELPDGVPDLSALDPSPDLRVERAVRGGAGWEIPATAIPGPAAAGRREASA